MATTVKSSRSSAMVSGPSLGASQTPRGSPCSYSRAMNSALRARQTATGTSSGPTGRRTVFGVSCSARVTTFQASSWTRRSLISLGICNLSFVGIQLVGADTEGIEADPSHGIDEAFAAVAVGEIGVDQPFHHVGHLVGGEGGTDDFAKAQGVALAAADADLVPLLALLIDAEDADVADVMVTAGVDAAGDVELQFANVIEVVQVFEAILDGRRHRQDAGAGQLAEIAAGAGDQVRQQADGGAGQAGRPG